MDFDVGYYSGDNPFYIEIRQGDDTVYEYGFHINGYCRERTMKYRDGKDIYSQTFHENGVLKTVFIKDRENYFVKGFYFDGTVASFGSGDIFQRFGNWLFFHPNGQERFDLMFSDTVGNVPVGIWKSYNENGELEEIWDFSQGPGAFSKSNTKMADIVKDCDRDTSRFKGLYHVFYYHLPWKSNFQFHSGQDSFFQFSIDKTKYDQYDTIIITVNFIKTAKMRVAFELEGFAFGWQNIAVKNPFFGTTKMKFRRAPETNTYRFALSEINEPINQFLKFRLKVKVRYWGHNNNAYYGYSQEFIIER
ncbi:MAG: hypothetical protein R6U85_00675 [Salinivirgaceae bacterium]